MNRISEETTKFPKRIQFKNGTGRIKYTGIAKARLLLMMINECDVIDLHFR